ncbi:hypothetical protein [Haloferula sp. A504]|uniref:hypothetical protein n=1 Tax=Haloferula sp. A504 TaxID=3373601 RepID=UPI0031C4072F|nr:hypothetical protein [Verrucomicrobiaceae bacterium E54]
MHRLILPLALAASLASLTSAQITSNWTGAVDQQWQNFVNWDNNTVPNNAGLNTYNAFLGGGSGLVFLNANNTLESMTLQAGAALSISNGFTFTVRDSVINGGEIRLEGNTSASRFSINDSSGDLAVQLSGSGTIVLDHPQDRIGGITNHVLVHAAAHTISGHGQLGTNSINLVNHGAIAADVTGEVLVVDPISSFQNDGGTLTASSGATARFEPGNYGVANSGRFIIGDGSTFDLRGGTWSDLTLEIDDQLAVDAEFSFDLSGWRAAGPNREILSDTGGVRTLRFYDTVALGAGGRLFTRFRGDGNAEP